MPNILLINGHQPFPTSPGTLNRAFETRVADYVKDQKWPLRRTAVTDDWHTDSEIESLLWADIVFCQFPVNSMGPPWSLKRYLDVVFTAGMDGRLAKGDGRSRKGPTKQYGSGGRLTGTRYLLSATLNAPRNAFDNPDGHLFQGRSLDDLLVPLHINFAFFDLSPLPTFAAYDVSKNPQIEIDFRRFDQHLADHLTA